MNTEKRVFVLFWKRVTNLLSQQIVFIQIIISVQLKRRRAERKERERNARAYSNSDTYDRTQPVYCYRQSNCVPCQPLFVDTFYLFLNPIGFFLSLFFVLPQSKRRLESVIAHSFILLSACPSIVFLVRIISICFLFVPLRRGNSFQIQIKRKNSKDRRRYTVSLTGSIERLKGNFDWFVF